MIWDGRRGPRGRGAADNPANRFEEIEVELEVPPPDDVETRYYRDATKTIIARNDSPDIPFDASFNPYRGCEHGCVYCYARPTHEFLGLSAGLDFETRIFVKDRAPELLREELSKPSWEPQVLAMSGVTDPYQPVERELELSRRCLEVLREFRNPVGVVTKSHLVTRDVDLLGELARHDAVAVSISITTLDTDLARRMEPRAAAPERRLDALAVLGRAAIPCGVMVAPVIPGLTDHEVPRILERSREAGAGHAGYAMLRLPHGVDELFLAWLEEHFPERRDKVIHRIEAIRGGARNDPRFGSRMRGEGVFAEQVRSLFETTRRRLGYPVERPRLSTASFRRPGMQRELF